MKNPVQGASEFRFLSHDVGCQGCINDGGVWAHSNFCKELKNGQLNFPKSQPLPVSADLLWKNFGEEECMPFVLVGDNAFPLTKNMKPYPEKKLDIEKESLTTIYPDFVESVRMSLEYWLIDSEFSTLP